MTATEPLNLNSLKLVQDELVATIEQAATRLEQFSKDRNNGELLQSCIDGIKQISGTLSLIQMKGVDLLAQELLEHINDFTLGDEQDIDHQLNLLTTAFFILPRYLEYCLQSSRSTAILLIPHINELRQARRAELLPDSYFYPYQVKPIKPRASHSSAVLNEDFSALARRLRHMYQVGLVKVLQGKQIKPSLGMMGRALERLTVITSGRPQGNLWWVASAALEVFRRDSLTITHNRKRLFSQLDREIKQLQQKGKNALEHEPDARLLKELLYLIVLANSSAEVAQAVSAAYELPPLPYNEAELARELELLTGPSANTLNSMAIVLQDELRSTKNILERAAQGGGEMLSETPELLDTLKKVADILSVVGLIAPSNSLKQEIKRISGWQSGEAPAPEELQEVADTLLYVESTVSGLGKVNLSDEKLAQINAISREEAISTNQLAEAEHLVFEEAQAGLALVKRGLSAFVESQYDKGHIRNVSATLASVRGGMTVLSLHRAAAVVASCIRFIDEALLNNDQPAGVRHMLETFADAIISLEHYLESIKSDRRTDDTVLLIAEESLEALGYRVG